VLAPVLAGDIAVVGDPALYATAGDARIADVTVGSAGSGVTVTVVGAGERVVLTGWAARGIRAETWSPSTGRRAAPVDATGPKGVWSVLVDVPASGWVNVHLRPGS